MPTECPLALPCAHVICHTCVTQLETHNREGWNCPLCRTDGPVTSDKLYFEYLQLKARGQRQEGQTRHDLYSKAAQLLERAMTLYPEDGRILGELALVYANGVGVAVNEQRAFELWKAGAAAGDSSSQYNLAQCYNEGRGTDRNCSLANEWYSPAAHGGNAWAQYAMGLRAERQNDLQQALEFYEASAAQDNSYAQNNLACCLKNGTEADLVRSFELLKQSATQGVPDACYILGACYANGIGVLPDLKQAVQWYREGADRGFAKAQHNLASMLESGNSELAADPHEAARLEKKAAAQGLPNALISMGGYYFNGSHGVEQNQVYAVELWTAAAEGGRAPEGHSWHEPPLPEAMHNLGCVYLGIMKVPGVKCDRALGMDYFTQAAALGFGPSQDALDQIKKLIAAPKLSK